MLGNKPKALSMPGKHCTPELHPWPLVFLSPRPSLGWCLVFIGQKLFCSKMTCSVSGFKSALPTLNNKTILRGLHSIESQLSKNLTIYFLRPSDTLRSHTPKCKHSLTETFQIPNPKFRYKLKALFCLSTYMSPSKPGAHQW